MSTAFQYARAADPTVKLFYNVCASKLILYTNHCQDYGAEGSGSKSDAVYNLVKGMLVCKFVLLAIFIK